jgi:hypothetical protein
MKHIVLSRLGKLSAIPYNRKAKNYVEKGQFQVVAVSDSKEKAQGLIMGMRAHAVVEKFAGHLPHDMKVAFKSEIAQLSTDMYNEIVK